MSGPYRPGYPGNGGPGNQPVSFKTDINRKKTKKWVAAKSYSYDGDDWGDDDDDEEEDEVEEAPPLPDTSRLPSAAAHGSYGTAPQPPTNIATQSIDSQSPTIARPADIYQRMQENDGNAQGSEAPPPHHGDPYQQTEETRSTSPLVIPEVKRLSGFGQDFLGNTSIPAQDAPLEAQVVDQGSSLHHNPSLGFNSVVHQAFDVQTPSSTAGDFSRSNSDSTSIISPIVSPWKSETDKTPTIAEEPMAEAEEPPANFKPGHRRDLSVPSPGNGPDRIATVTYPEENQSAEASLSSPNSLATPEHEYPDPMEQAVSGQATPRPLSGVHGEPTRENSNEETTRVPSPLQIPEEHQTIPQIVPSLSTETSPQDMESDRLRKEIMRSFSSEHIPVNQAEENAESGESRSQARQSVYLPSEYDSYWNDQPGIPPTNPLQLRPAEPSNPAPSQEPAIPSDPAPNPVSKPRQTLKKRFSWEVSDDSDEEDVLEEPSVPAPIQPVQTQPVQTLLISGAEAASESTGSIPQSLSNRDSAEHALAETDLPIRQASPDEEKEIVDLEEAEPQKLSYIAPVAEPEVPTLETEDRALSTQPAQPQVNEASLPTFRKIMEISNSSEKIRVFNETREQFAAIESGLSDWIRRSSESLPEHADLIQANGRLPGGAPTSGLPSKAKFPKLSSLGNLSLPTTSSHSDATSPAGFSPTHARRSSGSHGVINRQNVELKGKDLLHSAGVLGGKAGGKAAGAARGLFAKGKSKLRGADKGVSSMFRGQRRRSWAMASEPDAEFSDVASIEETKPVSASASSRYSLQPVPRIPSLRLGDSKPFRNSFDGEQAFSTKSRPFSVDFGRNLRSVEEETAPVQPASPSSLQRAMRFDDEVDHGRSAVVSNGHSERSASTSSLQRAMLTFSNGSNDHSDQDNSNTVNHDDAHPVEENSFLNDDSETDSQSDSQDQQGVSPTVASSELLPLERETSQSQVSKLSEDNSNLPLNSITKPALSKPDASISADISVDNDNAVSPPLPEGEHPAERRDSINSKISDISEDEMDRIREKFDEEGLYSRPREGSQVSDMTEDGDEYDDALREKLDEAGYQSDPEKDAWQQFPRPPTGSPRQKQNQQQPIRVVRMTRVTIDKQTSQNEENDTKRHSRFSFESEGNTLAEAMLENGHGHGHGHGNGKSVAESMPVTVTTGENAPDEAPPPFSEPEAPYQDDSKHQMEEERPAYTNTRGRSNGGQSRSNGTGPPVYRQHAAASLDITSKNGRLQELRTNRDSIASSSVSSISSPTSNMPQTAISPELHARSSAPRWSHDSMATPQRGNVAAVADKLGRSLFSRAHARTASDNLSVAGASFVSKQGSFGSSDSIAVQAAMSRNDLLEPSPLHQGSDTASDSSPRLSAQFRKMKFMKRSQPEREERPAEKKEKRSASMQPEKQVKKPVKKPAEKEKNDGKRGFSRFSGIFNRPNEGEQRERNIPPIIHQVDRTPRASPSPQPYNNQPPAAYSYAMPGQEKPLPPPPNGYYAPAEPSKGYPEQNYSTATAYQPKPAHYSPRKTEYPYQPRAPTQPTQPTTSSTSSRSYRPSPSTEQSRNRARDLRMRSRSPRPSPVRAVAQSQNVNYADPIYNLGKFNAVTDTDRIGDQSLPFPITLPDDLANGQLSPRNSIQPESYFINNRQQNTTNARQNAGLGLHTTEPSAGAAPASSHPNHNQPRHQTNNSSPDMYQNRMVVTKNTIPIELPVPNEDEEEIVMSSTAYPGQEWQPAGFEQWMSY